jgi:hypothetical protein
VEQKTDEQHNLKQMKNFDRRAILILQKWFLDNIEYPYANKAQNQELSNRTGLTKKQVQDWFTNIRKRKYQRLIVQAQKKNKSIGKLT